MTTKKSKENEGDVTPNWLFGMVHIFIAKLYRYRGLLVGFVSAWCYAVATVCLKALQGDVPSNVIVLTRVSIILSLSLISTVYMGMRLLPQSPREIGYHLVNAILLTTSWCLQFYAFHHMRTADVSAIVYGYITFVGLFARIFLKERFHLVDGMLTIFTLFGTFLIAQPSFIFGVSPEDDEGENVSGVDTMLPVLAAFAGSITAATSVIISRLVLSNMAVSTLRLTNWIMFFCVFIVTMIITVFDEWTIPPTVKSRLLCLANGVLSFVGFVMLGYALSVENSLYIALTTLSEVYMVFLFDILIFNIQPEWLNALGVAIIVMSSGAVAIRKAVSEKRVHQVGIEENDKVSPSENVNLKNVCGTEIIADRVTVL